MIDEKLFYSILSGIIAYPIFKYFRSSFLLATLLFIIIIRITMEIKWKEMINLKRSFKECFGIF